MMKTTQTLLAAFVFSATLLSASNASASLLSRLGGQAVYDTDLNVTWLTNTKLASTNTFGLSSFSFYMGEMTWYTANTWIGGMNTENYLGFHDWRLPIIGPVNGVAMNSQWSYNGTTDYSFNISAPGTTFAGTKVNEMAYLYYNELGNKARCSAATPFYSSCVEQPGWGAINTGPFTGGFNYGYWSSTGSTNGAAWTFFFSDGGQWSGNVKSNFSSVLVVRTGDVAAVPVPAAAWLLGSGLLGLIGVARRKAA